MTIRELDFLSPSITLFHFDRRTHTSKLGGVLVIIMIFCCVGYTSYLLFSTITHKRITSIFYKKFEFEAGYYSLNSSSMFHFLQIFSADNGGYFDEYDSRYIRTYTTFVRSNFNESRIYEFDHWIWDRCREGIDNKNIDSSLFENVQNFTNAACIRYYYNSKEEKYFESNEAGFIWPNLEHGSAQRNNVYLTTVVKKCFNDSRIDKILGTNCAMKEEINNYLTNYFAIYLYFTDNQVNPLNYSSPITQYLQTISSGIGKSETFVENYVHFAPLKVITNEGSMFGSSKSESSFFFDMNRKGTETNNALYFTITKYYHIMTNNVQIYERKYDNILDIVSDMGGIFNFCFYIFFCLNYLYNNYIIVSDTNSLFFTVKEYKKIDKFELHKIHNDLKNPQTNKEGDVKINNYLINNSVHFENNKNSKNIIDNKSSLHRPINNVENNGNINYKKNTQNISNIVNNTISNNINNNKNTLNICSETNANKNRFNNIYNNNLKNINDVNDISEIISKKRHKTLVDFDSSGLNLKETKDLFSNTIKQRRRSTKCDNIKNYDDNILSPVHNIKRNRSGIVLDRGRLSKIFDLSEIIDNINSTEDEVLFKKVFSFSYYLRSFCYKSNGKNIKILMNFRKHLLSEEHLFKSHIKLLLLEKSNQIEEEQKIDVIECFQGL